MNKYADLYLGLIAFLIILIFMPKPSQVSDDLNDPEQPLDSHTEPYRVYTEPARVTCYLWTGNKMANGEYPEAGYVATSDRTIPFGTEIIIDEETYIVGDRTNKRFQDFDIPTIDIYWEGSREDCLSFGVQYKEIIINK